MMKFKYGRDLVMPRQLENSLPWYTKTEARMLEKIVCGYCGREPIEGDTTHVVFKPDLTGVAFLCEWCYPIVSKKVT